MNTSTLESFISYCDDMMIAEEGFKDAFVKIKKALISLFNKLNIMIQNKIRSMKESKIKSTLMRLFVQSKDGLKEAQSLKDGDIHGVKRLQNVASQIKEEVTSIVSNQKTVKISPTIKKYVEEKDVEAVKTWLSGLAYFGDPDSFLEFKESVEYAQKTILELFDEDDGKEFTKDFTLTGYKKVARLMRDNFSKKKYDAVIDIGNRIYRK